MQNRTLFFGDNLEILREKIPDEVFDLIYLDPPFNSNRNYNVLFKEGLIDSQAQIQAFEDSWHWTRDSQSVFEELVGAKTSKTKINEQISNLMLALEKLIGHNDMLAYLTMMTVRLIELHRVLKSTGSIYLHCDPTASHYLKIVMDAIFGNKNFRNEIIWHYRRYTATSNDFQQMHDVIFRYSKGKEVIFNSLWQEYQPANLKNHPWETDEKGKTFYWKRGKNIEPYKVYINEKGVKMNDVWIVPQISPIGKERLGYPTQKPEALLERIIEASSNEGDLVLDPFCGCGTTVAVAERLKRNWVGIDITMLSINLIKRRLNDQFGESNKPLPIFIDGIPKDLQSAEALAKKDRFEFEYWALDLVNAMPAQSKTKENMRGADKGIDGIITIVTNVKNDKREYGKILVQVKSGKIQRNDIATLKGDVEREKAVGGLFITLEEPTKPMLEETVMAGTFKLDFLSKEFPKIQIMTVEELLAGKQPDIPHGWTELYYKEAKKIKGDASDKQSHLGI
jgi:site-specific DNA-methyltransferase (adenine-specific)